MLEAVVYSHRAAELVPGELAHARPEQRPEAGPSGRPADPADLARWEGQRTALRDLMWQNAGIVRSDARLERAHDELVRLRAGIERDVLTIEPTPELIELRNLADSAALIVQCARARKESRGLHYTIDHPYRDSEHCLRDTVVINA